VADVLSGIMYDRRALRQLAPLGAWLLTRGAAELRNASRVPLLINLMLTADEPAALARAVRAVVRAGGIPTGHPNRDWLSDFWDRIERFEPEGPNPTDVRELLECAVASGLHHDPSFPDGLRHPKLAALVAECWLLGRPGFGHDFTDRVLALPPPARLDAPTVRQLVAVASHLTHRAHDKAHGPDWVEAVARALVHEAGGLRGLRREPEVRLGLRRMAALSETAIRVARVLTETLVPGETPALAIDLLEAPIDPHFQVAAALRALELTEPAPDTALAPLPPAYLDTLLQVLHAPIRPVFGVSADHLFRGATTVRFGRLDDDLLVDVQADCLIVTPDYARTLASSGRSLEEQQALLAIYAVHELVHHLQRVGQKEAVTRLRETGNEHALMHLDLGADHAAALVVSAAIPRWGLLWLKDVQGRSILDFPTSPTHPYGSRMRKAARLVGLRLDYLMRTQRPDLPLGEGYAYAAFGATAGPFQVLSSGPLTGIVVEATATEEQIQAILGALDPANVSTRDQGESARDRAIGASLERLDHALKQLLQSRR
jgi:hypothetical protein